jgi:hypothetical protein
MARLSPEQQIQRILKTIRAWEAHARRSTFSRHSLAEFKAAMQPALDAHARVVDQRHQLRFTILERNGAVRKALQLVYLIGFATQADPAHGPNSNLYEALGYTREAVRRTKIRRARKRKRAQ